ncbi:hypothetical protein WJX73_009912 [Symbiochloris irregularis]|uniref:Uncharacterized protein n=1 Tax=Symbiochloris irregularis TaxID=706552 RepID=A0AAW1Q074_9CHLO
MADDNSRAQTTSLGRCLRGAISLCHWSNHVSTIEASLVPVKAESPRAKAFQKPGTSLSKQQLRGESQSHAAAVSTNLDNS